jgi:hypothetical protein
LTLSLSRFPDDLSESYVFPFHHVGFAGNAASPHLWGIDLDRSMGIYSYKRAYETAREKAKLDYRLYDARHTFITRLAENSNISEETIRQVAGHVSPRMLSRYAHIRAQARRDAIAMLEGRDFEAHSPQKSPQSADEQIPDTELNLGLNIEFCIGFWLVGVAGFEPATTRTPSGNDDK